MSIWCIYAILSRGTIAHTHVIFTIKSWYSADGVENVVTVDEDFSDKGGWKITSSVNAVEKLIAYNNNVRSSEVSEVVTKKVSKDESPEPPPKIATTTFVAPSLISLGRRTNSTSPSSFVTGFWVCPVGTGRSRFMSAAIGKTPFSVCRELLCCYLFIFMSYTHLPDRFPYRFLAGWCI